MSDPTGGWAKATEKASEAATELIRAASSLGEFVAPPFRLLVGMAEDRLLVLRAKRRIRLYEQFTKFLGERGLSGPTQAVAPEFMLPLIERASIETDDELQDVWAMMLANAADGDCQAEMRTAFISMLSEMTHFDVVVLAKLIEAASPERPMEFFTTGSLPDAVGGIAKEPIGQLAISLANLARLGCILPRGHGGTLGFGLVSPTALAHAFVAACTPPRPAHP